MSEISNLDRSKNRPIPCGLTSILRSLEVGESIILPKMKRSSIHPAARRAGICVTLRGLDDDTICVWRVPETAAPVGSASVPDIIFGEPEPTKDIFS